MGQYDELVTALKAMDVPFAEFGWATRPTSDFGVVALDMESGKSESDNGTRCAVMEGTADLYMHGMNSTHIQAVETVLETVCGASWELNSVQYEQDTKLLHYEWVFRVTK